MTLPWLQGTVLGIPSGLVAFWNFDSRWGLATLLKLNLELDLGLTSSAMTTQILANKYRFYPYKLLSFASIS